MRSWMLFWLLVPVGILAFFAWLIWSKLFRGAKKLAAKRERIQAEHERRCGDARATRARVISSAPLTSDEYSDAHGFGVYRVIDLQLDVVPPDTPDHRAGAKPTPADVRWDVQVTALPHVAPDAVIDVLVDAEDPLRVYPAKPWARTNLDREIYGHG